MCTVSDLLTDVRTLLDRGPCVGAEARDAHDFVVDPCSPEAVKFSLSGALRRATWDRWEASSLEHSLTHALILLGADALDVDWEDDATVRARVDAALRRAKRMAVVVDIDIDTLDTFERTGSRRAM